MESNVDWIVRNGLRYYYWLMFVLTHAADISEVEKVITSQRKIMKTFFVISAPEIFIK